MEVIAILLLVVGIVMGNFVGKSTGWREGFAHGVRAELLRLFLVKCMLSRTPLEFRERIRANNISRATGSAGEVRTASGLVVEVPSPAPGGRPATSKNWIVTVRLQTAEVEHWFHPAESTLLVPGIELTPSTVRTSEDCDKYIFPELATSAFVFRYDDDQAWAINDQ